MTTKAKTPQAPARPEAVAISIPDASAIEREQGLFLSHVEKMEIRSKEEDAAARETYLEFGKAEERVVEFFRETKDAAFKLHRAVCAQEKKLLDPLRAASAILHRKITAYAIEEKRKADELAAQLAIEARKREEDRKLAEAQAAEARGDKEGAELILSEEVEVPAVHVEAQTADVAGLGSQKRWKAEVIDKMALLRYVLERPEMAYLILPNETALNKLAIQAKKEFAIPGCKAIEEEILTRRRA